MPFLSGPAIRLMAYTACARVLLLALALTARSRGDKGEPPPAAPGARALSPAQSVESEISDIGRQRHGAPPGPRAEGSLDRHQARIDIAGRTASSPRALHRSSGLRSTRVREVVFVLVIETSVLLGLGRPGRLQKLAIGSVNKAADHLATGIHGEERVAGEAVVLKADSGARPRCSGRPSVVAPPAE